MAQVAIIGDGPAGLSAGLLLAKNGQDTTVFAGDETPMHHAHLYNYLGIESIEGSEFQQIARRQATSHGVDLRDQEVTEVAAHGEGFAVRTAEGETMADYLVLAGGKQAQSLATALGAAPAEGRVLVDHEYRTGVDRVYAVGRVARPERSQAIISAGAGATAALDILAREAGKDVHDWDTPPEG